MIYYSSDLAFSIFYKITLKKTTTKTKERKENNTITNATSERVYIEQLSIINIKHFNQVI
jgi:hypothetical protein